MHSLFKYTEPAIEDLTEKLTCFAQEQLNKAKLMHNITGGKKKGTHAMSRCQTSFVSQKHNGFRTGFI